MCNALKKGVWYDMSKSFREDLTGQRFGRLTVLEFVPNNKPHSYWRCRCDCGNITIVSRKCLIGEETQSCGCLFMEYCTKHKQSNTRIYRIWSGIKERCYNPNKNEFKSYGGRGIKMCLEWKDDFETFYDWAMANGYSVELSIDRIDVNGNYEPNNCRWADAKTQGGNLRKNIIVTYRSEKVCLSEAARRANISKETLKARYRNGDRGERLFRPVEK